LTSAEQRSAAESGRYTFHMPLAGGQTFAGFTVVRLLGSGGMGEVYLVEHPRLPRREALKILLAEATSDSEFRQRFNREADLAAALWHPHIVAVHDRGEFEGQLWITMDYVEGTDAAALIRDRYPAGLPEHFAAEIVSAVAEALDYAHERGLLHRDVKPANILLSDADPAAQRRRILLTDFGIARQMDDNSGLTATNMTVGSIAYTAPEQLMGSSLDGRADQYALAASAFQLLTGRRPFENSSAASVINSHLSGSPPKLAERRPELGKLDGVISKAIATIYISATKAAEPNPAQAIRYAERVVQLIREAGLDRTPQYATGLRNLAALHGMAGRIESGLPAIAEAVALWAQLLDVDSSHSGGLASALGIQARLQLEYRQPANARDTAIAAVEHYRLIPELGVDDVDTCGKAFATLAIALDELGDDFDLLDQHLAQSLEKLDGPRRALLLYTVVNGLPLGHPRAPSWIHTAVDELGTANPMLLLHIRRLTRKIRDAGRVRFDLRERFRAPAARPTTVTETSGR
jgi:serine/threonine protein kinase